MEDIRFELKKKRRKKRRTGTAVILLLLIAALAGAGYEFFYRERAPAPPKPREEKAAPAPTTTATERATVQLYFATGEENALIREPRTIAVTGTLAEQMKAALEELVKGPAYGEAVETIPPEANLREVYIDSQGRVYVDFSEELSSRHPGGAWSETLTVYSIVNTLAMNFSGIKDVQILIEGKEALTLAGHLDIRKPLNSDRSLLKGSFPTPGAAARP